jgi:hypothetical protein
MDEVPERMGVPLEQELEAAMSKMFLPEESTKAQDWVNWLDKVRRFTPDT